MHSNCNCTHCGLGGWFTGDLKQGNVDGDATQSVEQVKFGVLGDRTLKPRKSEGRMMTQDVVTK